MLIDDLTIDQDEELGVFVQQRPSEVQYNALCDEFGDDVVALVHRCFYLRAWKNVHGSYPYSLEYIMLKALLALEDELKLREAKEAFDSKEQNRRMEADIRSQNLKGTPGKTF